MKKFFFLSAAFAMSMMAQAQKVVSFGFEDADKGNYHCQYSLTPRPEGLGDWVNVQEGDNWIEQSKEAARTGEYGLQVLNESAEESATYSWNRGFKLANLPIKENVPYRVSFWIKGPEGVEGKLSSWLSVGIENFDKSFCTAGGSNYGADQITLNGDGEWQRVSFLSVYHGKEAIKTVIDGQSWVGNAVWPEQFEGADGVTTYKEHFGGYIPETFFFIANMNSAGEYMLDDICIEENVAIAGCTFNYECVKIDFGFPTNIADLAKENGGTMLLDPKCVTVKQGNTEYEIEYLEAHEDGFLYAFVKDGANLETESEETVFVSFTPAEDCPIKYTGEKRPGADIETVLGFENEVAYADESIDAISVAWSAPEFLSVVPENNSFNLNQADFKEVTFFFNKEVSLDYASATLSYSDNFGSKDTDITKNMTVGADGMSVVVTIPEGLDDNDYTITLNDVANAVGETMENPVTATYSIGLSTDAEEVETIYKSDFNNTPTNTLPKGWWSKNEDGLREYTEDGNGNPTGYGTGSRIFDGWTGDFTKAWYWCSRGTNEGYASFGEMVMDYLNEDGTFDEAAFRENYPTIEPDEVSLYLTPRKYNVSFKMAAWKGTPVFRFKLVDRDDNVVAQFNDFTAKPNLNGGKGKVTGVLKLEVDFNIENEGYYVMKFEAQDAQWQEFMMADVQLITMPGKAAYYNGMIATARENAEVVLDECLDLEGSKAFNDLDDEIEFLKSATFHSPSEVNAEIEKLENLCLVLQARMKNIEDYDGSIDAVKEGLAELQDTKYMNVDVVAEASDIVTRYGSVAGKDLSDEELAEVAPKVVAAAAKLGNVKTCTDLLTWGIYKAIQTAELLESEDFTTIDAAGEAVSDDREIAAQLNASNKLYLYKKIVEGNWKDYVSAPVRTVETNIVPIVTEDGELEDYQVVDGDSVVGIELTGYVANPKMYRVNGVDGVPGWTVSNPSESKNLTISYNGDGLSEAVYVADHRIEIYGDATYKVEQTIENMPVGKYVVMMATRTPLVDKIADYGRIFYYNAQNDSTEVWDKYVFAASGDETRVAPYNGGSWGYGSDANNTAIREVTVGEDGILNIGFVENYVSGMAVKHEDNTAQGSWTGTSFADDVHIYFVEPLAGYDYKAALGQLETALDTVQPNAAVAEIYNVNGVRVAQAQKGINIVKMTNGKVVKVLVK